MRSLVYAACVGFVFLGVGASGCSSPDSGGGSGAKKGTSGTDGTAGTTSTPFGGGSGASTGIGSGATGSGTFGDDVQMRTIGDTDCVAEVSRGERAPLDIYIMFDLSCSMGCNPEKAGPGMCCDFTIEPNPRIHSVRDAVIQFVSSPDNVGISVGLGYFGYMAFETTSCNPADYSTPAVPFNGLPAGAQPIIDSLNTQIPVGETPTGAALRGACAYTKGWAQQNPGNVVVQLLVTDGMPEAPLTLSCNPTLQDAMAAASECTSSVPQVPTYVLGVGALLDNLNQIAAAGGTQAAYLVEGGNVAQQVLDALNAIRGEAQIPCEFQVPVPPPGETLDYGQVNVEYTVSGGSELIFHVDSAAQCGNDGGWYYDDPNNPSRIYLCPSTCSAVETTIGGQVDVALGCATISKLT